MSLYSDARSITFPLVFLDLLGGNGVFIPLTFLFLGLLVLLGVGGVGEGCSRVVGGCRVRRAARALPSGVPLSSLFG